MKYYELGNQNKKTILLLPGTCCNVKSNFSQVIPLLAVHYHVIGIDYDGFDGKDTEFSDMLTITRKIERFIFKKLNGSVHIVYGSSLGGSFAGAYFVNDAYADAEKTTHNRPPYMLCGE